jgi:hypothetical protein
MVTLNIQYACRAEKQRTFAARDPRSLWTRAETLAHELLVGCMATCHAAQIEARAARENPRSAALGRDLFLCGKRLQRAVELPSRRSARFGGREALLHLRVEGSGGVAGRRRSRHRKRRDSNSERSESGVDVELRAVLRMRR